MLNSLCWFVSIYRWYCRHWHCHRVFVYWSAAFIALFFSWTFVQFSSQRQYRALRQWSDHGALAGNSGKTVMLCWIPGHVGIPGNERVDRVAKAALSLPISSVKVSAMDFLPRAKLLMRKEWQEIWNCCDGNKLHAINPTEGVSYQTEWFSQSERCRHSQPAIQIGHTLATHSHLLGDDEAFCATCYTSLTVNHILIECPQYNHLQYIERIVQ